MDIEQIARRGKDAARVLAAASGTARAKALNAMADCLIDCKAELYEANRQDLEAGRAVGLSEAFQKRLAVTDKIFDYMVKRLKEAAALPDPVGRVLEGRTMPSGLQVSRVAVPIGVVAIIYEARPNVTTDAAAVALKSGNAVILKGGSESIRSNRVLVAAMRKAIVAAGLPEDTVQFIDSTDHAAVNELLKQDRYIDVVIPRGGKGLIKAVSENTRIPVLKHYDGICHQYVAADADIDMAVAVVVNSKTERVEVCNALEPPRSFRRYGTRSRRKALKSAVAKRPVLFCRKPLRRRKMTGIRNISRRSFPSVSSMGWTKPWRISRRMVRAIRTASSRTICGSRGNSWRASIRRPFWSMPPQDFQAEEITVWERSSASARTNCMRAAPSGRMNCAPTNGSPSETAICGSQSCSSHVLRQRRIQRRAPLSRRPSRWSLQSCSMASGLNHP